jgi:hypothetical protein
VTLGAVYRAEPRSPEGLAGEVPGRVRADGDGGTLGQMGRAQEMDERAWDRGFDDIDGYVCPECVDDDAIKEYIRAGATETVCDFCGRRSETAIAMAANDVTELLSRSIKAEYNLIQDELQWDSEDGAYVGEYHCTADLIAWELGGPVGDGPFAEAVAHAAKDQYWCERGYYWDQPHQQLASDWELFVETVKHARRYTFLLEADHPDDWMTAGHDVLRGPSMLAEIKRLIGEVGLVRRLPARTPFYRCRTSKTGDTWTTANDLGSPPEDKAGSNRMSPAGVPMFYGAVDEETAIVETAEDGDIVGSIGKFVTGSDCWIVDLDEVPELPGLFDDDRRHLRWAVQFLQGFRSDIVKSIERDNRIHVDYVPTQIVTEYLRYVFRLNDDSPIAGLAYTSSRNGGRCIVLFVEQDGCIDGAHPDSDPASDLRLFLEESASRLL